MRGCRCAGAPTQDSAIVQYIRRTVGWVRLAGLIKVCLRQVIGERCRVGIQVVRDENAVQLCAVFTATELQDMVSRRQRELNFGITVLAAVDRISDPRG